MKKYFFLILYKTIAKHLPHSGARFFGGFSKRLRGYCCQNIFASCGSDVNVEKGAEFGKGFYIEIGDCSGLGINCLVPSNLKIGKHVMMGPNCRILSQNHGFDRIDIPMNKQGFIKKNTIIEDDVWIGINVIFTPGRTVKKGSIIGAGCVLTKDFPEYSIIGGNPSKFIRSRI